MHHKPRKQMWKPGGWQSDLIAATGELIGTFLCMFLGMGGAQSAKQASSIQGVIGASIFDGMENGETISIPDTTYLLMASTALATSSIFSNWIFFRATGASFNVAISITLVALGDISFRRFVFYVCAQFTGAIAAAAALKGLLPGPLSLNCVPSNGTKAVQALFLEMIMTFALCTTVALLSVEKSVSTPLAPLGIGFAVFSTSLAGLSFTGACNNPARSLCASIISRNFHSTLWVYYVGPVVGALLAAGLHRMMHMVQYWNLSPGIAATGEDESDGKKACDKAEPENDA